MGKGAFCWLGILGSVYAKLILNCLQYVLINLLQIRWFQTTRWSFPTDICVYGVNPISALDEHLMIGSPTCTQVSTVAPLASALLLFCSQYVRLFSRTSHRREGLTTNNANSHWHTWKIVPPGAGKKYKNQMFNPWQPEYFPALSEECQIKTILQIIYMNVEELKKDIIKQKRNELFALYSNSHLSKIKNSLLVEYK